MLGAVFGVLSAASFGLTSALIRRAVMGMVPHHGLYITVFTALPLYALLTLAFGQLFRWEEFTRLDYVYLTVGGIVSLVIGRYGNYRTIAALGSNRATPLIGSATLVSVGSAVAFAGEEVTMVMVVAIGLMMAGPAMVTPRRKPRGLSPVRPVSAAGEASSPLAAVAANSATEPRYAEGYFFAALTVVTWGVGPVFIRVVVADSGLPLLAGLITYIASAVALLLFLLVPGQATSLAHMNRTGLRWFLLTSVFSFSANLFRVLSLSLAPVAIVMPLTRLSGVFTVLFNLVLNRSTESFEPRVIGGIVLSVAGAILLVA
jgi:drug/metabolite transporter (DMT)-like permease